MTDLLLLHGLTYDHRTWDPVRAALPPGHRVLAPDLPGHGAAPRRASYALSEVVDVLHARAEAAGLVNPVVAGHSLGAVIATAYAAVHPVSRVVNVDQVLLIGPFGTAVRAAVPVLRGPDWRTVWDRMLAGMGVESLPDAARTLVETATDPRPDLLLGYWSEIIERPAAEIEADAAARLRTIAARGTGYHWVTGREPSERYLAWLHAHAPHAAVTVVPGGHFPHLADPARVARIIAG
ncbi:alpha/beta fold hydrolase [Catenuloplanes indicus]|uniref:Pimeloyl-ACP methyl ester carboxylesterase n=1 Tax=Catenuloplanes indicus TaxID=137267 RepID=A0AAE3VVA6_9ACTN|nr:alpha/beta fold hydrolase [Catenuloplanes indicus]MDQ0364310.1 pimeloyl-ACP methyl ester carboxylesterase [Catenuloplanes indicus]